MTDLPTPSPAGPLDDPARVRFDVGGLVPIVVQDVADGRVLMLAWADAEAIATTLATGEVHFHSRSRGRLWRKGETSGNVLRLVGLDLDCDGDALLATVEPAGPTCHRDERSCFDADGTAACAPPPLAGEAGRHQGFAWLETLWQTIAQRASVRPPGSYTARLLEAGVDGPARKVAEEAIEVLMAAKDDAALEDSGGARDESRAALAGEAADLLYHALVLLAERGLAPAAVIGQLRERHAR
jgi:phosphoribosyl-ATP pyrophosphohydrolase/phosphoribosyl-AMP cyclohydrolase